MSSSSTSSLRSRFPDCFSAKRDSSALSWFSSWVSLPYLSSAALFRSYWRSAFSMSTLVCSICSRRARSFWTASFSACHWAWSALDSDLRSASSFSIFFSRSLDGDIGLFFEGLALDLELHGAAENLVELRRHGIDLGAQLGGGFVHQVDGFIGQEPVADVAVG